MTQEKVFVLVEVSGGIAEVTVAPDFVDAVTIDWDAYESQDDYEVEDFQERIDELEPYRKMSHYVGQAIRTLTEMRDARAEQDRLDDLLEHKCRDCGGLDTDAIHSTATVDEGGHKFRQSYR